MGFLPSRDTPIWINNRDRLTSTRKLVEWLQRAGACYIHILDNDSSYQPLLDWYKTLKVADVLVHKLSKNRGPWALWESGLCHDCTFPFILTDSDCVPARNCPYDLMDKCWEVYNRYPNTQKVGPGLKIDNLPEYYDRRTKVLQHEKVFSMDCHEVPERDCYHALIDTTFALYRPTANGRPPGNHHQFRLKAPYLVEHVPWYENSASPSEEEVYYREHCHRNWVNW